MTAETMTSVFIRAGLLEIAGDKDLAAGLNDNAQAPENPAPRHFGSGGYSRPGIEL